jgi:tRNA A-37 threonylcarbamoyl transferase component Bud32/tetratricopeptide (TPR) repeat protein
MELRDRLQQALGSTYTVERELGGGGMSRVFAATDTALGRKVVIKVVPIELGAAVNVERFKREIQLAAGLQHPHIVPVLTAGEMNGVPYYTMPFVEGEPLRAKIAAGPLPISEVVSILRDVAKALGYAHERGVVHRDIKPDNVVLTGGAAAVIDFGIAKAISASRAGGEDGSMLTQVGMSIGTPAYMAPEQAAADPSADHRADIYSFGCMAYELLAGRAPFAGLAPQKLLAAHMGQRPQEISELRTDTPPALAQLVMQCLEKDPDARPQNATDIGRQLDAVTSTGSIAAMQPFTLGGPGALRRALIAWVIAFAAMFVIAKAAIVGIGLPDWVLPASMTVMALGLPLILVTAFTSLLTWRRTASWCGYGIGAFVAFIGVFMALRAANIGPFASLMGAGMLKNRDKILVADFTSAGDTTLGAVVAEAVRADLGQSPIVSIVTPAAAMGALQRMQRAPNTRVDLTVAREIARREGIKAIVTGDIHAVSGGGYLVTMKLVPADTGAELASLSAGASSVTDLIPTIGKLTHQLRGKMGESLKHLQSSSELAQVTTASLPALQKFTQASHVMNVDQDIDRAIPLYREAIALDTTFASAYRALAIALSNSGRDRAGQITALEKAYAHRDRLPEVERYLTIASYYTQGPKPDLAKAQQAYEDLLAIRPTQYAALNNLALLFAQQRRFGKAEELLKRSIAANPSALTAYGNLSQYEAEEGHLAAAESTFNAQLKASGNNPRVALGRANFLWSRGAYDAAAAYVDSLSKTDPAAQDLLAQKLFVAQAAAATHGKLSEALKLNYEAALISVKRGFPGAILGTSIDSAMVQAWFLGNDDKALKLLAAGLQRTPLSTLPPLSRPYESLAQVYGLAGRADLARGMLAEFDKNAGSMTAENAAATRHSINATIAIAEKRYADAAKEAQAADFGACTECIQPILGYAYDLAQQSDSAIAAFTRYTSSTSILNKMSSDQYFLALSYRRLAELWENKGDKVKAAAYYTKFIDLWKNADPDLQPKVLEAKRRLAKLTGVEGKA